MKQQKHSVRDMFDLAGRVAVITGGGGLLGLKHAEAIAELGGVPILVDIDQQRCDQASQSIREKFAVNCKGIRTDITEPKSVQGLCDRIIEELGQVDILINNAANNPAVGASGLDSIHGSRLEAFALETPRS